MILTGLTAWLVASILIGFFVLHVKYWKYHYEELHALDKEFRDLSSRIEELEDRLEHTND